MFSLQNNAAPLPSPLDEESLIHFAKEAELNQNFELAARYYQVRVERAVFLGRNHKFFHMLLIYCYPIRKYRFKTKMHPGPAVKTSPGTVGYGSEQQRFLV